jgi:hypothetical protein
LHFLQPFCCALSYVLWLHWMITDCWCHMHAYILMLCDENCVPTARSATGCAAYAHRC